MNVCRGIHWQYFDLPPPSICRHKLRWTNSGAISEFDSISYRVHSVRFTIAEVYCRKHCVKVVTLLLLLLLSFCKVFTIIYLKHTVFIGYIVIPVLAQISSRTLDSRESKCFFRGHATLTEIDNYKQSLTYHLYRLLLLYCFFHTQVICVTDGCGTGTLTLHWSGSLKLGLNSSLAKQLLSFCVATR
jgi:hypothetical protein